MSTETPKIVEVDHDALGWLLVYSMDVGCYREGDPVGEPDYYPTKRAASKAAAQFNAASQIKSRKKIKAPGVALRDEQLAQLTGRALAAEAERDKARAEIERLTAALNIACSKLTDYMMLNGDALAGEALERINIISPKESRGALASSPVSPPETTPTE